MIGRLIKYDPDRGFGFIRPTGGGNDIFVHISDAEASGIAELIVGDRYGFDELLDPKRGKTRAVNLTPAA